MPRRQPQGRGVVSERSPAAKRLGVGWYLDKGIEMAGIGRQGRVFLFGNELLFRAQPHGGFKFFFNSIYLSVAPR
jgi:hypothetical protein